MIGIPMVEQDTHIESEVSNQASDQQILDFYTYNRNNHTELFQRYLAEKKLKANPLFMEAKRVMRIMEHEIFHDPRNAQLRKTSIESGG